MKLFVSIDALHIIDVAENDTVQDVQNRLQKDFGLEDFYLTCNARPLENDNRMGEFSELSTLYVNFRLRGGKVHGSLARAGKVKAQTPKVEKKENKKKRRVGRAKRREQFNRRYVNVVPGVRRKGPNAQAVS